MKQRVKKNRLRPFLILVVMFLISLETAFAQDNAENVTGSAQNTARKNPVTAENGMPHRNVAKSGLEKKRGTFLMNLFNQSQQTRVTKQSKKILVSALSVLQAYPNNTNGLSRKK